MSDHWQNFWLALPSTIVAFVAIIAGVRRYIVNPIVHTFDSWRERLDDIPALIRVVIGHIADADAHPHYWGMVPSERRQTELSAINAEHIERMEQLLAELRRLAAREGDSDALSRLEERQKVGNGKHKHGKDGGHAR